MPKYCDTYQECDSCCITTRHTCETCTCYENSDCHSGCCIDGVCKREQYCSRCSSHEECDSKCCLQGNCYDLSYCPYYPIGMTCSYNYQCATYQCSSNICVDTTNTVCTNHTDCFTQCCYNGTCQLDKTSSCPDFQINMTCTNNWDCNTYICKDNRCVASLTGRCQSHEDCESGCCKNSRCNDKNVCSMKAATSSCMNDYECSSYRCYHYKCSSKIGEICSNHSDCEYKCCKNNVCSLGCIYLKIGVPCLSNDECESYICKSGICVGKEDAYCNDPNQCVSGYCNEHNHCSNNIISKKNLMAGEACSHDSECQNFYCYFHWCLELTEISCHNNTDCNSNCCVDSKCSLTQPNDCNAYWNTCNRNSDCKSSICSAGTCMLLNGGSTRDSYNCISNCLINGICVNSSASCYHKNAGEECSRNEECVSNSCNGVCIGLLGDICLNRYNCETFYSNTLSTVCNNHACKREYVNNSLCEVNEDCYYGDNYNIENRPIMSTFICIHQKCVANQGVVHLLGTCLSGCIQTIGTDIYSCRHYFYCTKQIGEICQTHKECNSGCCSAESKCISACPKSNVSQACITNYDCKSFYCSPSTKRCENRPCIYHQDCMTGCCYDGACSDTCILRPTLSSCTSNYQCSSSLCSAGKYKQSIWYSCTSCDECFTGCCSNGICKANITANCLFKENFEHCFANQDCKSNVCGDDLKVCSALISESCTTHKHCASGCCGNDLLCYEDSNSNNCKLYKIGYECRANYECQSYICDSGNCKHNISDSCSNHMECNTNYCNEDLICDDLITALFIGGDNCSSNSQCESFNCINHLCRALTGFACHNHTHCLSGCCDSKNLCSNKNDTENCLLLNASSVCESNYECQSYLCINGYCKSIFGGNCISHEVCISGYCNTNSICAELTTPLLNNGEACTLNSQCESYNCYSYCMNYNCILLCQGKVGGQCRYHKECNSGCCGKNKVCVDTGNEDCPFLYEDEDCTEDYQCYSTICEVGSCKLNIGEACSSHYMCSSGYCNENLKCSEPSTNLLDGQEACTENMECKSYNCTNSVCRGYYGNPCSRHEQCNSGCCGTKSSCDKISACLERQLLEPCKANYECENSICFSGFCRLNISEICYSHAQCSTLFCNNNNNCARLSSTLIKYGEQCEDNWECESYLCDSNKCIQQNGDSCSHHKQCYSGKCGNGSCMSCSDFEKFRGNIYGCALISNGESCSDNFECETYICASGYCLVDINKSCSKHQECSTNYCNQNNICQNLTTPLKRKGEYCTQRSECESYYCTNNLCALPMGSQCSSNQECDSLCCTSLSQCGYAYDCFDYPNGHNCSFYAECKSKICYIGYCRGALSDPCSFNIDCLSYNCSGNVCSDLTSSLLNGGRHCTDNSQCFSNSCSNSICDGEFGYYCNGHTQCVSGCCNSNSICDNATCSPLITNGGQCNSHYECQSYLCIKSICKSQNSGASSNKCSWVLWLLMIASLMI